MPERIRRILPVALAIVLVVAGLAVEWGVYRLHLPGPMKDEKIILVPRGAAPASVARLLAGEGVIGGRRLFMLAIRLGGSTRELKAGEFRFPAHASLARVIAILKGGETVAHWLTVAEGLTSAQVVDLLRGEPALSGPLTAIPAEGSLLPETYRFALGDSRQALLGRMKEGMRRVLDDLWQGRAASVPLAGPREALILASIVEKETALPGERRHIAGVFLNRLARHMRLQSDPTVAYAVGGGRPLDRPLSRKDLKVDSPFNTYLVRGLPPTPISNPGRLSLAAVVDPLPTDDLYFVADGSGGHAFAASHRKHLENVRRWRRLQKGKGG